MSRLILISAILFLSMSQLRSKDWYIDEDMQFFELGNGLYMHRTFTTSANARNLGNTAEAILSEWAQSVENVKQRFPEAAIIVPGHGASGNQQLLDHTIKLVNENK